MYKVATTVPPLSGERLDYSRNAEQPSSVDRVSALETVSSVSASVEWNGDEQHRLESALVTHSSALEPRQRWQLIAADVGSKTAGQCIARFKFIRETLKSGGSVAAAEAKAHASSIIDKAPLTAATKTPFLAPKLPAPVPSTVAVAASEASSNMPPIEIPDDLLTMTGVIAGAGICAGSFQHQPRIPHLQSLIFKPFFCSSNGRCRL